MTSRKVSSAVFKLFWVFWRLCCKDWTSAFRCSIRPLSTAHLGHASSPDGSSTKTTGASKDWLPRADVCAWEPWRDGESVWVNWLIGEGEHPNGEYRVGDRERFGSRSPQSRPCVESPMRTATPELWAGGFALWAYIWMLEFVRFNHCALVVTHPRPYSSFFNQATPEHRNPSYETALPQPP